MPAVRRASTILLIAFLAAAGSSADASAVTRSLSAKARLVRHDHRGAFDYFRGTAQGTLPGAVDAKLQLGLKRVSGTVTFRPRGGTITLSVSGTPESASYLQGRMVVQRGTGRFAHASGSARFKATLTRRREWVATVSVENGRLSY